MIILLVEGNYFQDKIINIKNKLNIWSIMKHFNNHFSTSAWVEELQSQPQNPVPLYKPQRVVQSDETDNLGQMIFYLCCKHPFNEMS